MNEWWIENNNKKCNVNNLIVLCSGNRDILGVKKKSVEK